MQSDLQNEQAQKLVDQKITNQEEGIHKEEDGLFFLLFYS